VDLAEGDKPLGVGRHSAPFVVADRELRVQTQPHTQIPRILGAIRHEANRQSPIVESAIARLRERAYVSVKLTVTVTIASKPIGVYFHCLTASIADRANTPFVDRRTVTSPIVPSA
jgi:hypothetical protein